MDGSCSIGVAMRHNAVGMNCQWVVPLLAVHANCSIGVAMRHNAVGMNCEERNHPLTVKTIGLDLAKDVFQVHGISETGRTIFNRKIKRAKLLAFFESLPPCMVGMEACGSAHHLGARVVQA